MWLSWGELYQHVNLPTHSARACPQFGITLMGTFPCLMYWGKRCDTEMVISFRRELKLQNLAVSFDYHECSHVMVSFSLFKAKWRNHGWLIHTIIWPAHAIFHHSTERKRDKDKKWKTKKWCENRNKSCIKNILFRELLGMAEAVSSQNITCEKKRTFQGLCMIYIVCCLLCTCFQLLSMICSLSSNYYFLTKWLLLRGSKERS